MTDEVNKEQKPITDGLKNPGKDNSHARAKPPVEAPEMIQVNVDELNQMKQECEKAQKEAAYNLDGWQRERAEFSNYKKRIEREQEQLRQTLTGSIIKSTSLYWTISNVHSNTALTKAKVLPGQRESN